MGLGAGLVAGCSEDSPNNTVGIGETTAAPAGTGGTPATTAAPTAETSPPATATPTTLNPNGIPLMRCDLDFVTQRYKNCTSLNRSLTSEEASGFDGSRSFQLDAITNRFVRLFQREVRSIATGEDGVVFYVTWYVTR